MFIVLLKKRRPLKGAFFIETYPAPLTSVHLSFPDVSRVHQALEHMLHTAFQCDLPMPAVDQK